MSLVLDAGALIAHERGSKVMEAHVRIAAEQRDALRTSTAVIAQVWRESARQVALVRLLRGVEEVPLTSTRARAAGTLLRLAKRHDIVDAAVIELAANGDEILTSDPDDLIALAEHSGKTLIITPIS